MLSDRLLSSRRRSFGAVFVLLLLASGLLVVSPSQSSASFPGANGRIFFHREVSLENTEIFSMKPDGTNRIRLTNNSALDADPVASPDGRWVAFESDRNGLVDVYKMKADGTRVKRLTTTSASDPGWSPNGNRLVYANDGGNEALYTIKADGSDLSAPLTEPSPGFTDGNPRWAPNGNWIVFDRFDTTEPFLRAICFVRPDGGDDHCVTDLQFIFAADPEWSPDSKRIAFAGIEAHSTFDDANVFVMKRNGGDLVRLTSRTDGAGAPAYSPDGKKILFETSAERIFRMTLDGFVVSPVTPAGYDAQKPDWAVKT